MSISNGNAKKNTIGLIMIPRQAHPLPPEHTYERTGHTAILIRHNGTVVLVTGWVPAEALTMDSKASVKGRWNDDMKMIDHPKAESFEWEVSEGDVQTLLSFFKNDASKTKWGYHFFGRETVKEGLKPKNCVQSAINVLRKELGNGTISSAMADLRDEIKREVGNTKAHGFLQQIALREAQAAFTKQRLTNS